MKKTLRLKKSQRKHDVYFSKQHAECFICTRSGKNFIYWKIIPNIFPYDKIASRHDMLVLKRHIGSELLIKKPELDELRKIKSKYLPKTDYDIILENLPKTKSAKDHYHIHLIKLK